MSTAAFNLLVRLKVEAKRLRQAAVQTPDLLTAYVNTGVQAEVTGLALPGDPVPDTDLTKQEYLDLISVFTEFQNFWTNAAVATQDNESFVQVVFEGA